MINILTYRPIPQKRIHGDKLKQYSGLSLNVLVWIANSQANNLASDK